MGETTKIEWTDATVNFWHGCKKVSPGCKYCYMFRDKAKYGQDPNKIVKASSQIWRMPYKIKKPTIFFVCSWSDFFIEEADEWRHAAWRVIRDNPHHKFQILTKRPERIRENLPYDFEYSYSNVWLGISAENQAQYDKRISYLMDAPGIRKFVSFEPLLGPIIGIDRDIYWAIVGGESGNDNGNHLYRECKLEWIEHLVGETQAGYTPIFVKQMGTHLARQMMLRDRHGRDVNEFPEHLQLREMPNA